MGFISLLEKVSLTLMLSKLSSPLSHSHCFYQRSHHSRSMAISAQNNIQIIHRQPPRRTFRNPSNSNNRVSSSTPSHPAITTLPMMPATTQHQSSTIQQITTPKENTFPCSFPRGSTPPARSLFQTILTVTVGEEKRPFLVHREILCAVSPFFAAALNPSYDFRESRSSTFNLSSARPVDFEYLVQWIYTRTLTHEEVTAPHPAYFRLIRLWILADELQVEGCKNAIIDFMAKTADESNSVPTPDDTVTIFGENGVREGCGLRALVVDLFAWKKTDHLVEGHDDSWFVVPPFPFPFFSFVRFFADGWLEIGMRLF